MQASPGFRINFNVSEFLPRVLTPPYVSATPEVTYRSLRSEVHASGGEKAKFSLVLCSDGLADMFDARGWTREEAAQNIAKVVLDPGEKNQDTEGLGGNLALHLLKEALGEDLEKQSMKLTADLEFQHLDDTTIVVLSW